VEAALDQIPATQTVGQVLAHQLQGQRLAVAVAVVVLTLERRPQAVEQEALTVEGVTELQELLTLEVVVAVVDQEAH
jgi:hypothetical protein